jgi:hypothetical protein
MYSNRRLPMPVKTLTMPVVMSIAMTFLFVLLPHMPHRPHHWHFVITSLALPYTVPLPPPGTNSPFLSTGYPWSVFPLRDERRRDSLQVRFPRFLPLSFLPHYQSFFCLATTSSMLDSGRYPIPVHFIVHFHLEPWPQPPPR